ncbi:hypothetical protein FRC03_000262 [Tulasnella sp. 419]|nr:hypothetical protein FRC02_009092 [Tulasnella sp. 418]KAG8965722.1 hypothetical protein FRC03_000262 [Tulasnella sp. 419]
MHTSNWRLLSAITLSACLAISADAAKPYSSWMADSVIARGEAQGKDSNGNPFITYEHGIFQRALEMLYNKTGSATYYDYMKHSLDNVIDNSGNLLDYNLTFYTLDDIRLGESIIFLHQKTGQSKYKTAADTFRQQIIQQPRTNAGAFWHRSTYPYQQWLDGIYMADNFYAHYTSFYNGKNITAWDDILKQYTLAELNLRVPSGLLKHGYDESKTAVWADDITGACIEVWDRALGWYFMSLVDVLDYFPQSHPGRAVILSYLKRLAPAVKAAAESSSGIWWLVMSQPGRTGNRLESSATSMFVYSFLKAIRKGYITKATYAPVAKKAYEYLVANYLVKETDGTLGWLGTVQVGSLGSNGTFEYYISVPDNKNDLKGVAPFIYASLEYEAAFPHGK